MLTDDEIASMRDTVTSAMPDQCRITRRSAGALDPGTGAYTAPAGVVLWAGPCRVRSRDASAGRDVQIGDARVVLGLYVATLPVDADGFDVNDELVVTSSTTSVELVGVPLLITDIQLGTWDLGRRIQLQAATP